MQTITVTIYCPCCENSIDILVDYAPSEIGHHAWNGYEPMEPELIYPQSKKIICNECDNIIDEDKQVELTKIFLDAEKEYMVEAMLNI